MDYLKSKHYLHRAWTKGFYAVDDDCPYCVGTHEWAWWWDGWSSGIPHKILKGMVSNDKL
jgi:hypothetical protein